MLWKSTDPKIGDIIRTKVTFYHHYGIFVDENRVIQFGLPDNVNRPAAEVLVLASDVYTFLGGGALEVMVPDKQEKKKLRSPKAIVAEAEAQMGQGGYDVFSNNCEHFVWRCAYKK